MKHMPSLLPCIMYLHVFAAYLRWYLQHKTYNAFSISFIQVRLHCILLCRISAVLQYVTYYCCVTFLYYMYITSLVIYCQYSERLTWFPISGIRLRWWMLEAVRSGVVTLSYWPDNAAYTVQTHAGPCTSNMFSGTYLDHACAINMFRHIFGPYMC
jgi:hypothetical protein